MRPVTIFALILTLAVACKRHKHKDMQGNIISNIKNENMKIQSIRHENFIISQKAVILNAEMQAFLVYNTTRNRNFHKGREAL